MSFLFPAFLLGAMAVAVPIALHLLRRDVAPEVPFTAVRLLKRSPIERSHRRRLRDLILLATRVAALGLLAFAFARPYLRASAARAPGVRIVAIDRSFSMGAPGRFERVLDMARAAIDEASGSEEVGVVTFDDRAVVLAGLGTGGDARAALAKLRAGSGTTRYGAALARAVELAAGRKGEVVIVTDLQRAGWENQERAVVPAGLDVEVRDVGQAPPNLAMTGVRIEPGRVVATVTNEGPSASGTRVTVNCGDTTATAAFSAPPGASIDVPIACRAPSSGSLAVSVDDPGGFTADNTRYVLLDPQPRRHVLVVANAGGSTSGFYLSHAIDAASQDVADTPAFAVTETTGPALAGLPPAQQFTAVVLLSSRGLDKRGRDLIAQSVRRGGGLLVAGAPDVEPSLVSAMFDWQPPVRIREQQRAVALSATDLRHPIFRPFGALAANLGQVRFDRIWNVQENGWEVAARFTDGAPALLERAEGQGRVVLFASDLDKRWNDFPLHPAFVPFAAETLRYLSGGPDQTRDYLVAAAPRGAQPIPGIYQLAAERRTIAVNVDPRESATARLSATEFAAMLDNATTGPAGDSVADARDTEAHQGYWRYGLLLMIAALVAESFVGRA